jgi:predicted nucleic acid-binding Zn ribbon protein
MKISPISSIQKIIFKKELKRCPICGYPIEDKFRVVCETCEFDAKN